MPRSTRFLTLFAFLVWFTAPAVAQPQARPISRIAFGSCCKQDKPQPIWDSIVAAKPEMFLFIGDNIYGDSEDLAVLQQKWNLLGSSPGYQKLKKTCPILATWDDHDYGADDAGADYPKKKESQKLFLDFFDEPADSPRRQREGVYDAHIFGPEGKRVQVILLDTRYFRTKLIKGEPLGEPGEGFNGPYTANPEPAATILGKEQWSWLEKQLKAPAEVRIIASSIQVIANDHGWEKWGLFPLERERLFRLIHGTGAKGVVMISGDRHHAEISRTDGGVGYPLFDITSSSLNAPSKFTNELGRHRIGLAYPEANFGQILIDWSQEDPLLRLQVCDEKGKVVLQQRVPLSKLQPREEM